MVAGDVVDMVVEGPLMGDDGRLSFDVSRICDGELYRCSSIGVVLWTTSPLALVLKPLGRKCSKLKQQEPRSCRVFGSPRLCDLGDGVWCVAGHGALVPTLYGTDAWKRVTKRGNGLC